MTLRQLKIKIISVDVKQTLKKIPSEAGVYIMTDEAGTIIYIGKAKCLKKRVSQYFHGALNDKTLLLVGNIRNIEYIITKTEYDALSLENNLIKKHKPKYNILLKDDKNFPYLKIDLANPFPRFEITRRLKKDKYKYFGPFAGLFISDISEIISMAYKIRSCGGKIAGNARRACLNYHIKNCTAPCINNITREKYLENVNSAVAFLKGNIESVEKILTDKMLDFAEREEFELAGNYKAKLAVLDRLKQKRLTAMNKFLDADVWAVVGEKDVFAVTVMMIRSGMMLGVKNFFIGNSFTPACDILEQAVIQYYSDNLDKPKEIILNCQPSDGLKQFFADNILTMPNKGIKKQLCGMAEQNALDCMNKKTASMTRDINMTRGSAEMLQKILGLPKYPRRIECFDISNISGTYKVGSMAVFTDGEKDAKEYRRFKIETVDGSDDYKSLKEMLARRLAKLSGEEKEHFPEPDLIVIDGGKGQLSACVDILKEYKLSIPIISLAEKCEEIFMPGRAESIRLPKSDNALRLLIRIRDEAHRFAVTYHRGAREKGMLASELDKIDGIGKARRIKLIEHFKDIENIRKADEAALGEIIGKNMAKKVREYFNEI